MGVAALATVSAQPVSARSRRRMRVSAMPTTEPQNAPWSTVSDGGRLSPPQPQVNILVGDSVARIQSKLNSVGAGGSLVFPGGSTFNWAGGSIIGKSNVTIWADGVVTINNATCTFDFARCSNWTVRGCEPGQGFQFNGGYVNSEHSINGKVGCNVFNNCTTRDDNASAIRFVGSTGLLIINNDFNDCDQGIVGSYDWDNITIDGNHVTGGTGQFCSIGNGGRKDRGRNIIFRRNIFKDWGRCVIESAGTADGTNSGIWTYLSGLVIDNNQFIGYGNSRTDPAIVNSAAPISIVARAQTGTIISNNYIEKGPFPLPRGGYTEAIEINSSNGVVDTFGNTIVDIGGAFPTYGSAGQNAHGNFAFNSGAVPVGNTILRSRPARPAPVARISW
jgi:hypothetical protein